MNFYRLATSVRRVGVRFATPMLMAWTPMLLLGLHPVARIPLAILPATRMKSAVKMACEMIVLVKDNRVDGGVEYSVRILCHFLACRRALWKK
jgi:hypothetical protein